MKTRITTLALITVALLALTTAPVRAEYNYNHALQLDGNGDYVQVNTSLGITTLLAVEAWIKTSVTTGDQAIIARYNAFSGSNLDDQFLLSVHNGKARFQVNPGDMYVILDGTRVVADGQWHHVAGFYRGGSSPEMFLQVDGSFDSSRTVPVAANTPLNNPLGIRLRIGALYNNGAPGFFFNGLIDEVRLWDSIAYPWQTPTVLANRHIPLRNSSGAYPLRAAWRFNGYPDNGFDVTFTGNATVVPISDLPVNADSAIALDGGDYVNIVYSGSALTPTNRMTIEAWVSSFSHGGQLQSVVSKFRHNSGSDTDDAYFLGIEPSGVARFQISVGSSWQMVQGTTNLLDGGDPTYRWHHLAGVFTGTQLRLYVDGRLEGSVALSGSLSNNNTPLYLGASQEGTSGTVADFFYGLLDDVRIWNRALSATEVRNSANGAALIANGLVANWWFEGDFINIRNYRAGNPLYWGAPAGAYEDIEFCPGTCSALAEWWTVPSPF